MDTALALQALKAANYPDLSVSNTALAYLTNSQNTDGGFGFYKDDTSSVYMTAVVSATLQQFPQTTTIATAITKATAYLSSHQNIDGGFGSPSSTVYETSFAYSALIGVSTDATILGNALNYITTTQSSNGSWNDDPYSTALALKALYLSEHIPLPPPAAATTGSVMGTIIDATTKMPLSGVAVQLSGDAVHTATTDANGMFALSGIPVGSQQINLTLTGYSPLTITASISAASFINLGKVGMSVNPISGTVMGIVWNADKNTPFAGVTVQATSGLMNTFSAISAADGSYKITGVTPGTITVGTPYGPPGAVFWNITQTGTLAPGGIYIYNPMMSSTQPAFVNVFAQTDKAIYRRGDSAGISVTIRNNRSTGYPVSLKVHVTDPSGTSVYDTSTDLNLIAKSPITQNLSFTLPTNPQPGFYTVLAEVYDASAAKLGDVSTNFGIFTSQISVSPVLPVFNTGANTVTFSLANTGTYAVSSGVFNMILKDPDGQVISSATQSFSLASNGTKALSYTVTLPAVRFGTYTLTYTQSDETTSGVATTLQLPNMVSISPVLDKTSYRIRETASLATSLSNTGNFSQAGMTITVAVPDAGFTKTLTVSPSPQPSPAGGEGVVVVNSNIPLPATMTAGQHTATITLTLPSGSTTVQTTQLTVPNSALSVSLGQATYTAGGTINPVISNTGGVDTTAQYTLGLYDAKAALISSGSNSQIVQAGVSGAITIAIPAGAVNGSYSLIANYKDSLTGKNDIITLPLTIAGVKGTLNVQSDKQSYLVTESVTAISSIAETGTAIQNGSLHLQVTAAGDNLKSKTWTTQADFQQGTRDGVDTYGVNDWLVPNDDFSGTAIDRDKWTPWGNTSIINGALVVDGTSMSSGVTSNWQLEGDFDIQVDFTLNQAVNQKGAQMYVYPPTASSTYFHIDNSAWYGYESGVALRGSLHFIQSGINPSAPNGRFRLTRVGSTITSYYQDANHPTWTQLYTYTDTLLSLPMLAVLYEYGGVVTSPTKAGYDNFKVNAGRITTVNETVNSVRLLPLNDNFDSGTINLDRWNIFNTNYTNITAQNGKLALETTQANTYDNFGVDHKAKITGDVTAQVDYGLLNWPSQNMEKFALIYTQPDASRSYATERIYDSRFGGNRYSADYGDGNIPSIATSDTSGSLKMSKNSGALTSSYLAPGGWTTLKSAQTSSNAGSFLLHFWNDPGYPNPITKISFDNFQISGQGKYAKQGTLREKFDAGSATKWFALTWSSTEPIGTSIKFRTRTAQTEADLAASPWSAYITASGSVISNTASRWIEIEATLETTDANITPLLHDFSVAYGTNAGDVLWQKDVPVNLAQGLATNLTSTIGSLGTPGKLYLQGTLTSSTGQTITTSEYPFYVIQGNTVLSFSTDKKIYQPGETVTITGTVKNLASITASGLSIRIASGTQVLYTASADIPANGVYSFTTTTTAGPTGVYPITGTVAQNGSTLAEIADQYEVSSASLTAALTAPDSAGNDSFNVLLTLKNIGKTVASAACEVRSINYDSSTSISILPGETKILQYAQQITSSMTYTATCSSDFTQTLAKTVIYTGGLDTSISTAVVTDKMSYGANEQATITSTVMNQSGGSIRENLTAKVTVYAVSSQQSAAFTETKTIATLMPDASFTFKTYWNTGINAAGTYPITLEVKDASGAIISTGTQTLVISSSVKPSASLKGQITLGKQGILTGETVTVNYSITNTGNIDFANIGLSILTVDAKDQTVYATLTDQTTLGRGGAFAGTGLITTQNYGAKDYMVILRANIYGTEETLSGTYFRVEGAPSAPSLAGPANGSDVLTFTPTLNINNASDPNDDKLNYEFEVYSDSGMMNLVTSMSGVSSQESGVTSWVVAMNLAENQTYYWRARAYDGWLYGPWMSPAAFRVNTVNDPPTAPLISSPADGGQITTYTPVLVVANSTDPDSPSLTYNFDVALDPGFIQIVATTVGVMSSQTSTSGTTSWIVPVTLTENTWYYWRAQADDWLTTGPWSSIGSFFVNTTNEAPTAPVIQVPVNGATVGALETDIIVVNSTDPDSQIITYFFEVDTVTTFDSPNINRSSGIAQGQNGTTWHLAGLQENTQYYVRVKASDGQAESSWSSAVGFFANAVNEPPTAPILANPSNGSGVTVFTPTLSVHNATDPDRDILTYEFEVYADAGLTTLTTSSSGVRSQESGVTSWSVPVQLIENRTYFWRVRAFDGTLYSPWMPQASFMINTANDAPSAPAISTPANNSTVTTLTPVLSVVNATDPDSQSLTYDFEVYAAGVLVASQSGVSSQEPGVTSWTIPMALADNTAYQWRCRAFDGNLYGPWMAMANFTVHIPQNSITSTIKFDPNTLNKKSNGNWVTVVIELPNGYKVADIAISSIRFEGTIPAEVQPAAIGDNDKNGIPDLMVKFKRSDVINLLPNGDRVPVHVTGKVGTTTFEGVDIIRVIK